MNLFEPIYNLPLLMTDTGDAVAAKSIGAGWGGMTLPLGDPYGDRFKVNRAAKDAELISEFLGIAYACANMNGDGVAKSTLRLYIKVPAGAEKPKGYLGCKALDLGFIKRQRNKAQAAGVRSSIGDDTGELREITNHPILDLLKRPEPDPVNGLGAYDHLWLTQIYLELIGRVYWLKGDGKRPSALWLIPPMAVREIFDTSTGELTGYGVRTVSGEKIYPPEKIIKFRNADPAHPRSGGFSPLRAAMRNVRLLGDGDAHINALLQNGGFPGAVWSPKGDSEGGGIGAAEAQRVRAAFRQQLAQGGRGGLMVTEMPGTLNPFSYKPEEIIEVERAKWMKTGVCNSFAVPDTKLERNAANLAAAKTADFAHSKDAILPRCTRIQDILNGSLVLDFDPAGKMFLAFDSPIPDDEVFELEQNRVAASLGAVTRNEVRSSIGLPWRAWGDVPTIANNITTVSDDGLIDPSSTEMAKQEFAASQPKTDAAPADDSAKAVVALAIEMKNMVAEMRTRNAEIPARLEYVGTLRAEELRVDSIGRPDVGNLAGTGRSSNGADLREERRNRALDRLKAAGYSEAEIAAMSNGHHQHAEL